MSGAAFCTGCGRPLAPLPFYPAPPPFPMGQTPVARSTAVPPVPASRSSWLTRPTTAIVAALVAVLAVSGAAAVVVDTRSGGTATATTVAAPTSAAVSAEEPGQASPDVPVADPAFQLREQAISDSPTVEGLAGKWVPQISSKRPGLVADGRTYDEAAILAEHQALRTTHPAARLVWTGDFANYRGRDFWATVVGAAMPTAAAANAWCDAQALDADHCYAVRLTHSGGPAGNSVQRPHR